MKRLILIVSLVFAAWTLSPVLEADAARNGNKNGVGNGNKNGVGNGNKNGVGNGNKNGRRAGVPELDPGVAGGAIVLLIGGVAYIVSRRRREELP